MSSKKKVSFYKRLDVRLAVWYTITFLTIILLIFGFLDYRLRHNLLKEIDRMLVDEACEIIDQAMENPENLTDYFKKYAKVASNRKYYPITFQVIAQEGNPIYTSLKLKDFTFPKVLLDQSIYKEFTTKTLKIPQHSSPFRLCTYYYKEGGEVKYVVRVVTYLRMLKKNVSNFRQNLLVAFLLAFLFGSLGGWFLSHQSLRPIDKIIETTKRITATNLSERLPLHGTDDELDRLAMTINQMFRRLEESFQKLTQFTADAAHELRTPITAIKGESEVLLSHKRSSEEYQEALVHNLERLNFLTKLINDLLLLSQADEGKMSLQMEAIDLSELIRELWEAFNIVAAQKKINFVFHGEKGLSIEGDTVKLKQLFSNLIDNAIKYTPEGGEIRLFLQHENGRVKISVKDTGVGIPSDDLPYIFNRFYRVDKSRSRHSGGVGLGLSICQWIVKAHQGTIEVESQPQYGTTFVTTLPTKLA